MRPGVYIMKNDSAKIIYIGKAKQLKNRVSQYFGSPENHTEKVRRMVDHVSDFDYIVTDSEYEALVLECSLIKLHKPHYNILLKDEKGYNYVKISADEYPRITLARQVQDDGGTYLGPFLSGYTVKQSVDEAQRIFRLPTCNKKFPQECGKGRPCLNYSIKQCMGLCRGRVSREVYLEAVNDAVDFLKGGTAESVRLLTERMERCAENLQFEKAAQLRDRIKALQRMSERQKVIMSKVEEQDVFAIAQSSGSACCMVFRFVGGRLIDSEQFMLGDIDNVDNTRAELLRQYYSMRDRVPPRVTVDGNIEDMELLERWLSEKAGRKVSITIPQRGEQQKLVEMCRQNAAEHLANPRGRLGSNAAAVDELMRLLSMQKAPDYIEAYDISNTGGSDNVAGMVVFEGGLPLKSAYKKFTIKTIEGQDDYGSMREVISRRLAEYEMNKESGEGFGRLPDLILLDGGEGHVSAVKPLIDESGLPIALFGMVKDDKHRTRAIAENGGEITISSHRAAFTLVSSIQEEVHRFAIGYHRQKRGRSVKGSTLTEIPGIGANRAKQLLKHFKTITAIKGATIDELLAAEGMNKPAAKAVYSFYHPEQANSEAAQQANTESGQEVLE